MHPYYKDFADVFFASDSMLTEEGKRSILHKISSYNWLHYQIQNYQFFNVLDEGLF